MPKSSKNVVTNNIPTRENNTNRENTNSHKNNKKIPPINVYDVEPNKLIEFVKDGLKITEFKIKEFNNNKVSLYTSSSDDYYRIKAYFEKTKTKFFSYTSKDIKKKSYLLKGLSANIEPNEILDELNKFQNDNLKFVNVSPFVTKKSLNGDQNLPIYLVQITADSKVNELKTIKGILYRCIRWEALRKPEIPQCRNCQRFFHSAANCFLPRRCVKCNQNHEPGKCSLQEVPYNEKEKLFCVVCNKYGHPATYKGCEKYKDLQQKLRAKKRSLTQKRSTNPTIYVNDKTSFANMVKSNNPQMQNINNPSNNILEQLNNSMRNLATQLVNLNKQLQLQTFRIDTLFSMMEA